MPPFGGSRISPFFTRNKIGFDQMECTEEFANLLYKPVGIMQQATSNKSVTGKAISFD